MDEEKVVTGEVSEEKLMLKAMTILTTKRDAHQRRFGVGFGVNLGQKRKP